MKPTFRAVFCLLLLSFLLGTAGCGYRLASDMPTVMGDRTKTLKVKGIDHPTMYPWLTHALRSSLRDEINARNIAQWVDSGHADYEIQINVKSFTMREWMRNYDDVGILFDTSLTLEAVLYKSDGNKEVWRSGLLTYSDRVESAMGQLSAQPIITQVMRRLTDKLQNTF